MKPSKEEYDKRELLYGKRKIVKGKAGVMLGDSKYKHVIKTTSGWRARLTRLKVNKYYTTEKEAALRIDMALIKNGEEPVNILKKKL